MASMKPMPSDRSFHPLRVRKIIDETHDAKSVVFEIPAELEDTFRYESGQFLTLEVEIGGGMLRRCYSLASSPVCDTEHKVTVKRVSGGRVSNWLHDNLAPGDVVSVKPPEGRFLLRPGEGPLLFFAGGSGITPVISIMKSMLLSTRRTAKLLYANRDPRSIIFRAELDALTQRYPGAIEIWHRLDDVDGFVTEADVHALAKDATADCYLCGPGPFMETVEGALLGAGFAHERVHVERFVSPSDGSGVPAKKVLPVAGAPRPEGAPQKGTIDVIVYGKRHTVPYAPGSSILRAALDAGVDVPYSCEEGFCGCCVAKLAEGTVEMAADDALSAEEKKRGFVLTCQSRLTSPTCTVEFLDI
jgi:3-ketosteroid 9alpha-monooxygenase subunit B